MAVSTPITVPATGAEPSATPADGPLETPELGLDSRLLLHLYTSHFLSTWNSRLFEFGAVLFLASIFPNTLQPMSIYALVRCAAAILFAQAIGSWIDRGNRLYVVRISIIGQRLAVVASCGLFWALERNAMPAPPARYGLFALTVVLACVEKLCAIINLVSIERDWVCISLPNIYGLR
jgi:solute carrier family 40 (iron-regulated transporter), member 1